MNYQIYENDKGYNIENISLSKTFTNKEGFITFIKNDFNEKNKKDKKYLWGDGLLNIANTDFSQLTKICNNYYSSNSAPTYYEVYSSIIDLNIDSLHFKLLKKRLISEMKQLETADYSSNGSFDSSNHLYDTFDFQAMTNFFNCEIQPILMCHNLTNKILDSFTCNNDTNKKLKTSEIIKNYFSSNSNSVNYTTSSYKSSFDNLIHNSSIVLYKNKLTFLHTFNSLSELCTYELYKFLNGNFKIAKCKNPDCNNFFKCKNCRAKFCNDKCRENYYKNNPFIVKCRTTYKNLYAKHYAFDCPFPKDIDILSELNRLEHEYECYWKNKEEANKLLELNNKIKEIKNRLK